MSRLRAVGRSAAIAAYAVLGLTGFALATARVASAPHLHLQRLPTLGPAVGSELSGLSCPSTTTCIAVGQELDRTRARAFAEERNGVAWSILPRPQGLSNGALNDVVCTSPRSCIAVGHRDFTAVWANQVRGEPIAEHWDGRRWSADRTARPLGRAFSELDGVSCRSATDCVAVGFSTRRYRVFPLVERWNGLRWSLQRAPTALDGTLDSVSCPSRFTCIAVGGWEQGTLRARWDGRRWLTTLGDQDNDDSVGALYDVSCPAPRVCVAVGGVDSAGGQDTIIERWGGRHWSHLTASSIGAVLHGVSCTSERACAAVGEDGTVARWNGRHWSSPRPRVNLELSDVSCMSARRCVAVGTNSDGPSPLTAVTWH